MALTLIRDVVNALIVSSLFRVNANVVIATSKLTISALTLLIEPTLDEGVGENVFDSLMIQLIINKLLTVINVHMHYMWT